MKCVLNHCLEWLQTYTTFYRKKLCQCYFLIAPLNSGHIWDQICHCRGFVSKSTTCNRGFVQGSGLGPTLFVILTLDLNTVSNCNVIIKLADDSTLLVPDNSDVGVEIEFNNVQEWAGDNTMILNLIKTKVLIFHNPKARTYYSNVPILLNIERVTSAKLLGIYTQSNFSCDIHIFII